MTDESVELESAPRRSGLTLLLRRTPFDLALRRCTIADLRGAVPGATMPPQFKVKIRDRMLILRKYGGAGPLATGWAVKAHMEETADGVQLTGHHVCVTSS